MTSPTLEAATSADIPLPRTWFACGPDNPQGLRLKFRLDADSNGSASWVPGVRWEGLRGIVHGGILTRPCSTKRWPRPSRRKDVKR